MHVSHASLDACAGRAPGKAGLAHSESLMLGKLCRSENSGVAELKEDGQVSCDTAQNLRLTFLYITPHARAAARPHAGASTSFAFSCSFRF